jgi:hypothetical protein
MVEEPRLICEEFLQILTRFYENVLGFILTFIDNKLKWKTFCLADSTRLKQDSENQATHAMTTNNFH